eukprot:13470197-Heterocapsa_arctica.AAC.1
MSGRFGVHVAGVFPLHKLFKQRFVRAPDGNEYRTQHSGVSSRRCRFELDVELSPTFQAVGLGVEPQ